MIGIRLLGSLEAGGGGRGKVGGMKVRTVSGQDESWRGII